MADEAQIQPTLETILKKLNDLSDSVDKSFSAIEGRLTRIEIRLDKIESIALETRAMARETQLDLKHLHEQLNLPV